MSTVNKDRIYIEVLRRKIAADELGYREINRIGSQILAFYNTEVHIDLRILSRFEPSMIAPLVIILRMAQIQGNRILWRNISKSVREIFALHNLVRSVNYSVIQRGVPLVFRSLPDAKRARRIVERNFIHTGDAIWPFWASFGLREFDGSQTEEFASFAKKSLENNRMPRMTEALRDKFFEGIDELFGNSCLHSKSIVRHAVSGFFDKKTGILHFVFADGGRGIGGAYEAAYGQPLPAELAIEWALTPGSTTRQGDIPGGLGLKILRKFIQTNRGGLTIISQNGFWRERDGHRLQLRMPHVFPGTVVSIEINTADENSYDLDDADADDLW